MKTVLYLGPPEGLDAAKEKAADKANLITCEAHPQAVESHLKTVDALLDASMSVPITDAMIVASPMLSIISTATTGADHIDLNALNYRGIDLCTLREDSDLLRNLTPAAELSFTLLMALARQLVSATQHVRNGGWIREKFPGIMLHGKTIGIIGCGRIGQWMARYAQAFGMTVLGYDPHVSPWPKGIKKMSLPELAGRSDFISVHVHLSEKTQGLVSKDIFSRMKPGVIFINTSRGALVDEAALLEELQSNRMGGAGLDVLNGEPDIRYHPLRSYAETHSNLLITPHCGGFSPDAVKIVCARAMEKILDHFDSCL